LSSPRAVAVDAANNIYIAEFESSLVRKVDANGIISTYAGGGTTGLGDGGPASQARLSSIYGLAIAPDNSLIIVDTFNHRIRRVDRNGIITTVAGNGAGGYAGDSGPATSAELNHPTGVAYDSSGNLYIADFSNLRVRKVDTNGVITTVAGNGQADTAGVGLGDGLPATLASISGPYSVAVDNSGNLYVSDQTAQRIRAVDTSGTISTVAGTGGHGFSGDGGPATSAEIWSPSGMAIGPNGALYFADLQNNRIRAIDAPSVPQLTSVISTKTHRNAGPFDVYLRQDGGAQGIECRSDQAGNYTLTLRFKNALTNVGGASVASGIASVDSSSIDSSDPHNCIVRLTGVRNAQTVTLSLKNVTDSAGNFSSAVAGAMKLLIGDVNGSGLVDSGDVFLVRQQTGKNAGSSNFHFDINASGLIDSGDVFMTRQQTGTSAP
jgi:sugar lactone lactonase YvrE